MAVPFQSALSTSTFYWMLPLNLSRRGRYLYPESRLGENRSRLNADVCHTVT